MRRTGLFLLLAGTAAVAACSSGGSEGRILGRVVDDVTGAGIGNADVRIGTTDAESDTGGEFTLRIGAGERPVRASAPLYRILNTDVMITEGDNTLKLRLVPCNPATDTDCATPTPTATGAIPIPTPNLFVSFDDVNLPNDNSGPFANEVATMLDTAGVMRSIGGTQSQNPLRISISECWIDGSDSFNGLNTRTLCGQDSINDVDHCLIRWYGEGQGIVENDAMVELRVTDNALWRDGTRLDVASPAVTMRYLEGTVGGNFSFNVATAYVATAGTILLVDAGFCNVGGAEGLVVTSAAGFVVPNLP